MTTSQRIVLEGVFSRFSDEPQVDAYGTKKIVINDVSYKGHIGGMIDSLRNFQGKTLKEISLEVSEKIGKRVPLGTIYSWTRGSTPNNAGEIEAILAEMIANSGKLPVWYEPGEVRARMMALRKEITLEQMAEISGVSINTLSNWIRGFYKVSRHQIDALEKSIHRNSKKPSK